MTGFHLYEGNGEWFELSKKPIDRASFSFGEVKESAEGYNIKDNCINCRSCGVVCPQNCIDFNHKPAHIIQEHCLHCGNCLEACPVGAVEKRKA